MAEDNTPGRRTPQHDAQGGRALEVRRNVVPEGDQGKTVLPVLPRELLCFCEPGWRQAKCARGCYAVQVGWR